MLSPQDNELLTRIGPGTPAGELLRRYWYPLCPITELSDAQPMRRMRIFGENLLLFRDQSGHAGLIPERCPHRGASLYYGFIEQDGVRCPYHGWKFDAARKCLEQPFEPSGSPLKDEVTRTNYQVEKLAGLYWGYLGPQPAPLLPRWEVLVGTAGRRQINVLPELNCNWLQIMENAVDTTHTHYLHGHMMKKLGMPEKAAYYARPLEDYTFQVVKEELWTGVRKIRKWGGGDGEVELGHPLIFPCALLSPQREHLVMHFRTPIDDTHTKIIRVQYTPGADTSDMDWESPPVEYSSSFKDEDGEYILTSFAAQDGMAWETEGEVFDRTQELLGVSDAGIALYRRMLKEQIEAVQAGREPVGLIRDPQKNQQITIPVSEGQAKMARKMKQAS